VTQTASGPYRRPLVEAPWALTVFRELFMQLYAVREPVLPLERIMHWPAAPAVDSPQAHIDEAVTAVFGGFFYNTSSPPPRAAEIEICITRARAAGAHQFLVPTVRDTADAGTLAQHGFIPIPAFIECVYDMDSDVDNDLREHVGRRRHKQIVRLAERARQFYDLAIYSAAGLHDSPQILGTAAALHDCNRRKYGHRLNLYSEPILQRLLGSPLGDHLLICLRTDRVSGVPVQASISLMDRGSSQLYMLVHGIRHEAVRPGMNLDIADIYDLYKLAEREGIAEINLGRGMPEYKRSLGATRFVVLSNWLRTESAAADPQLAALSEAGRLRLQRTTPGT
jgi:hypothetical protein